MPDTPSSKPNSKIKHKQNTDKDANTAFAESLRQGFILPRSVFATNNNFGGATQVTADLSSKATAKTAESEAAEDARRVLAAAAAAAAAGGGAFHDRAYKPSATL
jgi:hypothetical protein